MPPVKDPLSLLTYDYVNAGHDEHLRTYKYQGTDHSLLYKYVFSPLAQACVDYIFPTWLAPNIITLIGLMSCLTTHVLIWIASPHVLAGDFPSWLCYLAAIGQFCYIILDNSDGKQARKTGSSSPLGLLFDHGCDAVNTFIAGIILITVTQFGNTPDAMVAYLIVLTPFYLATWEEFYTNHLELPIINGPNEGILGVMTIYVVSGLLGTHIWTEKVGGWRLNQIALVMFVLMAVANSIMNVASVASKAKAQFKHALTQLVGIGYIVASSLFVSYLSPSDVISRKPRAMIYFFGLLFAKLVGQLQVSHVTKDSFNQFSRTIWIPITILNLNTASGFFLKHCLINEDLLVMVLCVSSMLIYAHFAVNVIRQFCEILGINVFSIPDMNAVKKE